MEAFYKANHNTIYNKDCRSMEELGDESVDLIATDPPYGISFMGKDWDTFNELVKPQGAYQKKKGFKKLPRQNTISMAEFFIPIWKECLRILKPGAFAFVMCSPRADVMAKQVSCLQEAGFEVRFTPIYWTYACLSADTEVLTQEGWKDWERLRKSNNRDRIVVYDTEKDIYLFESPETWHSYSIREDMFRIESEDTEQFVSRNHKVYTSRGFILAENLKEQDEVVFLPSMPSDIWNIPCGDTQKARNGRDVLLSELSAKSECVEDYEIRQAYPSNVRSTKTKATRGNVRREEQSLEGWRDLLQNTWELCRSKIYSLSERIFGYGTQGRLCYGTSLTCGTTIGQTIIENRGCSSQRPRPNEQQPSSNAICHEQRPQTIRGRISHKTTLARVHREYYEGIVYCPTVSTGCFVARRNGKIFLTGNSGFPKAQNIGKAVDKRGGEYLGWFVDYILEVAESKGISRQELTMLFPSRNNKPTGWLWNKQFTQSITIAQYNKIKDFLDLPFESIKEAEREIVGRGKAGLGSGKTYAFTDNNKTSGEINITTPATPQAKALDGSYAGFQPKPAVEVIIVAMKPLSEKTYVEQALKNQKGITWLDDCRVPYESENDKSQATPQGRCTGQIYDSMLGRERKEFDRPEQKGRFPANLLVSDDVLNDGRVSKSSQYPYRAKGAYPGSWDKDDGSKTQGYTDSGSFSRYFDLEKWWEEKIKGLPESVQRTFPFLIVPKASKDEKNKGCEDLPQLVVSGETAEFGKMGINTPEMRAKRGVTRKLPRYGNPHPTVKPIKLMSYLITLGSREGDTVVDPFIGTWATAIACQILGRKCTGYEINANYCEIGKSRLTYYCQKAMNL